MAGPAKSASRPARCHSSSIAKHRKDLAALGEHIGSADIRLWVCDSAHGDSGAAFIGALSQATGARISASTRRVGAAAKGGSWNLDTQAQPARAPLTAEGMARYQGVMAIGSFVVTDGAAINIAEAANGIEMTYGMTNTIGGGSFGGDVLILIKDGAGNLLYWYIETTGSPISSIGATIPAGALGTYQGTLQIQAFQGTGSADGLDSPDYNGTSPAYPTATQFTFHDGAFGGGNGNTAVTSTTTPDAAFTATFDTVRPTVAITLSDSTLAAGETALVTFTFSEAPVNFSVADVTAPNGVLSGFTATGNPLVYTATFTPTASVTDTSNLITVGTAWSDAAGNAPAGSTNSLNYIVDTMAPTVTTLTYGTNDGALAAGEAVTLTVTFSEAVNVAGGVPTLSLDSGGTATYVSGSGTTALVFSYIPANPESTADLAVTALNLAGATIQDAAGNNAVTTGAVTNPTGIVAVDTAAPSAPIVALLEDSGTPADLITNNGALDVTGIEPGALLEYSVNGGAWSAAYAAVEGLNDVLVRQTDAAGNVSASTLFSFTLDPTADENSDLAVIISDNLINNSEKTAVAYTVNGLDLDATATVTFTDGVNSVVGSGGFADLSTLADGPITVTVSATDTAGNIATGAGDAATLDTAASAVFAIDDITTDNIINADEAGGPVFVTGTVTGDVADGGLVTLMVNGNTYFGTNAGGTFSIEVLGSDLAAATSIHAEFAGADAAGNPAAASDDQAYSVDLTADEGGNLAVMLSDSLINNAEKTAVAYTVNGLDAGATATVTFSDGVNSVVGSGGTADLSTLADGPITVSVSASDAAGNIAAGAGDTATLDTAAAATITLDDITTDNIINAAEAGGTVAVTGTVGGDVTDGDIVTLTIGVNTYTGAGAWRRVQH